MPWCNDVAVGQITAKTSHVSMAKSEIPSIVVQSGGGSSNNCDMEQQYPSSRPPRLEKQEEFDEEEPPPVYMPSTVTIQIEDRGSGPDDNSDGSGGESSISESKAVSAQIESTSEVLKVEGADGKERHKVPSQRVKLLVRSQAVHDDASPPPDLETIVTNTNMLSVTNAPAFATQSKSSNKNRLNRQGSSQGSQGSTESSSGLSRDSSTETYTDSTGVDLQQFIIETLHKNQKDRITMLKIENELTALVKDSKRHSMKFAQMSSYNRMLVHRVAAFFGFDHYVDANGTSVIVNKTKNTRLPDARFQEYFRDELLPEEPKKSILKRDSISFEEGKEKSPERQSSTDSRRSKSFEEREEEYEKARARIFNQDEGLGESPISRRSSQEDIRWPSSDTRPWSSTDSDSSGRPLVAKGGSSFETEGSQGVAAAVIPKCERPVAVLTKAESESKELLFPSRMVRPVMTKASSFGGISLLTREGSSGKTVTPKITKAESFNVTTLSSSPSLCALPSQVPRSSTPSPSLFVTSTIGMQTTCPSQFVAANAQQTFPIVAGQPPQLHIPIQQFSSQVSTWPVENRDVPASDYPNQGTIGQQFSVWPSSTAPDVVFPGSIVINPQSGTPYVNMDNVTYRYKVPQNTSGQTIMLAPYQPIAVQPPNQVPISSHVSPPSQQAPSAHPAPAPPSNLQLSLNPQPQPQQQQQQPVVQIPQPPTVVYVPYITSQISSSVVPQQQQQPVATGNVQAVPQQQQIPPQAPSQAQVLADQRTYSVNPSSGLVEELATQVSGLSLLPHHLPQSSDTTATGRNVGAESALSPQNYVVPAFKSQGYVNPQGNFPPFPVYYMQQVQQASNVHPVRYVFPANSPVSQQVVQGSGSSVGQIVTDVQSHLVTQANTQMTGRSDQSKCGRASQLQAMASSGCRPGGGLVCPRGVPVMQDLCLIGHPLQHHFNPLMFPQQRPITRFIHSQNSSSNASNRPPKNRGRRNKGSAVTGLSNGARNGTSLLSSTDLNAGHVLEIEGLPEGMKKSEIERYLEPATGHGAKIQFLDSESGALLTNETDFVVCSRHLVIAVFESDTAAQSALLGIKTPKFQLRPLRRSTKDISQKYS